MNFGNTVKISGLILLLICLPGISWAKNLVLPITLDHSLLNALVSSQLIDTPDGKIELLNDPHECKKIFISEPRFSEENARLKFEIKVRAKTGFHLINHCFLPMEWEGVVVFFQTPVIEPGTWMLSFQTQDSRVLNKHHKPEIVSNAIWKLIKGSVHAHINSFQVDLSPLANEMKSFLVEMFPETRQPQARIMAETMEPTQVKIQNQAVHIGIHTDISSVYDPERTSKQIHLNEAELAAFIKAWESTDDFIIYLLGSLPRSLVDENEKNLIFETLLDSRYRFIEELTQPVHGTDFVRTQFILAWETLSPIFRKNLRQGIAPLEYLSFFSSMDALMVLDSMGPSLGIEISHSGLVRLAKLIPSQKSPLLLYSMDIDENLRQVMDLDPALKESPEFVKPEPAKPESIQPGKIPFQEEPHDSFLDRLLLILNKALFFSPFSQAIAGEAKPTAPLNLEEWLPPKENLSEYLSNFRQALKNASGNTISKTKLDPEYHDFFQWAVDAVAWQESCLRQFEIKNGKIKYLRSYNNTSVGAMQINERVWRGIYNQEKLRWNIHYNLDAGSEILELYLNKYILKKTKNHKAFSNQDNIARILYALYNGGPGQFPKFLERLSADKLYLSDDLFYEKYLWVKNNQWENAGICLLGQ